MTNAQRLELRASEIRQRLNELSGMDELTDETRSEMDNLSVEYADVERQRRAAILAGDAPELPEPEPQGSEQREIDALIERAEIGAYLRGAASGVSVGGAERELRQAILGDADESYMPIDMLMPLGELETRADASTDVSASIQHTQRNIIGRIFAETAGAYLGVQRPSVPIGDSHYYTLTGGTTADVRSDGVAIDAAAATFTEKSVSPVRATARYLFGVETTARIRGFEEALRADIRAVLGDKLDSLALNGQARNPADTSMTEISPAIEGIISQLTEPTDPSAVALWDDYLRLYFSQVDGKTSMDGSNVRLLVNPDTYKHASLVQIATSGNMLRRELPSGRFRTSANMPITDATNSIATALTYTASARTGYVQPVWRGISLIRDVYSKAAEGQVALTAVMLTGAAMVDASQYGRHKVKITVV